MIFKFFLSTLCLTSSLNAMQSRESEEEQKKLRDIEHSYASQLTTFAHNPTLLEKQTTTAEELLAALLTLQNINLQRKSELTRQLQEHLQIGAIQAKHFKRKNGKVVLNFIAFQHELETKGIIKKLEEIDF